MGPGNGFVWQFFPESFEPVELKVFEADDGEGRAGELVFAGILRRAGLALGGAGAGGLSGVGAIGGEASGGGGATGFRHRDTALRFER